MREGTKASNTTTIARKILHTWTRRTGCWIRVVVHDGSEIKLLYVYGIHICSETWGSGLLYPEIGARARSLAHGAQVLG